VTLAPSRGHDDDEVVSRDRRERERERERERAILLTIKK
jgi:hypothetical protein